MSLRRSRLVVPALLSVAAVVLLGADLPPAAPPPARPEPRTIELTGRLEAIAPAAHCGMFHLASVSLYGDLQILEGEFSGERMKVVHACAELPRRAYGQDAGDLEGFRIGDVHRLRVTREDVLAGAAVVGLDSEPPGPRFSCLRVDAVPATR